MEQTITIQGTVKEVRTFSNFVTLFVKASKPEKYQGKLVKFTLGNYNCQHLLKWAQLEIDSVVSITRTQNDDIPRNRKYTLTVLKSEAVDADEIAE
jgi:hypothetical protein